MAGTAPQGLLKGCLRRLIAPGHHLHPSIGQVSGPASDRECRSLPAHEIAEPYPLYHPAYQVLSGHPLRLDDNQPLNTSIAMGRTDTPMIAMTTRLKFSLTTWRLPK